jgi:hypothetical protein
MLFKMQMMIIRKNTAAAEEAIPSIFLNFGDLTSNLPPSLALILSSGNFSYKRFTVFAIFVHSG